MTLCQLRPGYETALAEYGQLQERKSRILKDRFEQPGLLQVLPEYNLRMAQVGRNSHQLPGQVSQKAERGGGGLSPVVFRWKGIAAPGVSDGVTIADPFAPVQTLMQAILEHQARHERAELESGQCLSGPHKDDFEVLLDGKESQELWLSGPDSDSGHLSETGRARDSCARIRQRSRFCS